MKIENKKIAAIVFAIVGVVALSLGFASVFGDVYGNTSKVKDVYSSASDIPTGVLKSHIKFAFIGGIVAIIAGVGLIISSVEIFIKPWNKTIVITTSVLAVVALAIGIAAIVCQGDLNNLVWVAMHVPKETV